MTRHRSRFKVIHQSMWGSRDFAQLDYTSQHLFIWLLTGPRTSNIPGVVMASGTEIQAALEPNGWPVKRYAKRFAELSRNGMAYGIEGVSLTWLPGGIRWNPPHNQNMVKGWFDQWQLIPECSIKDAITAYFLDYLSDCPPALKTAFIEVIGGLETVSDTASAENGYGMAYGIGNGIGNGIVNGTRNKEKEKEQYKEKDKDIPERPDATAPVCVIDKKLEAFLPTWRRYIREQSGKINSVAPDTLSQHAEERKKLDQAIRLDKVTAQEIIDSMEWLYSKYDARGEFDWRHQIVSIAAIRKKTNAGTSKLNTIIDLWKASKNGGMTSSPALVDHFNQDRYKKGSIEDL